MPQFKSKKKTADEADTKAAKYVRQHFSVNECYVFVPRRQDTTKCVCGAPYAQHKADNHAGPAPLVWSKERCIRKIPTNAFGRIQFLPGDSESSKASKYVRLTDDSDLGAVMELLTQYWHLVDINQPPEIMISVAGGAENFSLPDGLQKKLLDRGLMKAQAAIAPRFLAHPGVQLVRPNHHISLQAVETTNGWLITDGIDTGVAKAIGRATRQSQSLMWQTGGVSNLRYTIQSIGVGSWSRVLDRDALINRDPEKLHNATFPATRGSQTGKSSLNPNHTHFLLVDDGRYDDSLDAVAHFRAELEKRIAQPVSKGGLGIPVICILIEGGMRSIERVAQSVRHDVPVLICDGTGRASDLLAMVCRQYDAIQKFADKSLRMWRLSDFRRALPAMVTRLFLGDYGSASTMKKLRRRKIKTPVDRCVNNILTICERKCMVYIFNVNGHSTLDTAILLCLLECQKLERANQLQLALRWNRADVAKAKIFTVSVPVTAGSENGVDDWRLFIAALCNDLTEFAHLFIDYGLDLKSKLTVLELRRLYMRTLTAKTLPWYVMHLRHGKHKDQMDLSDVNSLLIGLTRRFYHPIYARDNGCTTADETAKNTTFPHPFQELFLWAALLGRRSLALYFWEQCAEPLTMAIVGTLVCDVFMGHAEEWSSAAKENLVELKNDLENLAVDLIKKAFFGSIKKTMVLLHRKSVLWGNCDCMELAALARDKAFLATEACQLAIWDTWKRGFTASAKTIAICTFTIIPAIFVCKFNKDFQLLEEPTEEEAECSVGSVVDGARRNSKAGRVFLRLDRTNETPETSPASSKAGFRKRPNNILEASALCDDNDATGWRQEQQSCQLLFRHLSWLESETQPEVLLKMKEPTWWKKLQIFYTAPVVKFTYYTFFYLLYLLLYAYVILFAYRPRITMSEIALQIWTYAMICEEVYLIFTYPGEKFIDRWEGWWGYSSFSAWRHIDFFGPLFACLAFSMRWWPTIFNLSRLLLNINFILCMFRLFKVYYVHSYLGPKVVMIKRMTWDLAMFFGVLIIILLSYTIVSQSTLHPDRAYFHGIYWELLYRGVWVLFGEVQDELTQVTHPDCLANNLTDSSGASMNTLDCVIRSWPPPILLGAYCFVGSILLVNMLIAAFASIFEEVQSQSQQLWRYYMYFLVKEYKEKSYLPAPFNILEYVVMSVRHCCHLVRRPKKGDPASWKESYEECLRAFENAARSDSLDQRQVFTEIQVGKTLQQLTEELHSVSGTLASIQAAIGSRKVNHRGAASDIKASRERIRQRSLNQEDESLSPSECTAEVHFCTPSPQPKKSKRSLVTPMPQVVTVPAIVKSKLDGNARGPILKEAASSPSLPELDAVETTDEDSRARIESEVDSVFFDDFSVTVSRTESDVLETFHDHESL